jgi:hypothetical protein
LGKAGRQRGNRRGGENWVKSSARAIAYYYDHAAEIESEVQANSEPAAKFVNRLV